MRINTNTASQAAQRTLESNRSVEAKASEHLAAGSRIVQAGDDAAGLSISSTMNAHIRSTQQALRNASDGVSMIQVAEGSLQAIGDILIRFRELGIQASSDTVNDSQRRMMNSEVKQLSESINQIANSTEYLGKKLLTGGGSWPVFDIQVGIHADELNKMSVDRRSFNVSLDHLGLHGIDYSSKENAQGFLIDIDRAISTVSGYRATFGSIQSRLNSNIVELGTNNTNLSSANSRIKDADIAIESSERTKGQILSQSALSVLTQANQAPNLALKLLG